MRQSFRAILVLVVGACNARETAPSPDAGQVLNIVAHDVSPPLRELAKLPSTRVREVREAEPWRRIPLKHMSSTFAPDSAIQTQAGATPIAAPSVSFEGIGAGMAGYNVQFTPPDTDGDVGPNHYMQVVNSSLAIFSKTGTTTMGPMDTSMVWSGFAGACATSNDGDATVRYDHIADRWVVAQFSVEDPYYQCVAVSTTPDPTGTYNRYQFTLPAFNDYPKVGLWPDAYYFTFNMFGTQDFQGGKVCAMDRTKMLAGDATATMQCFDSGVNYGGLLASDVDGKTMPAAGSPNYVVAIDSNTTLAYWTLKVDFANMANSAFTGPTSIPVTSYTPLCGANGASCVKQPSGGVALDSLGDRAMNRFVYRRFADHESLLFSHSVVAGTGGGVRWYELRTPAAPTVFQQGTFAPNTAYRWLPSVAMDGSGDIAAVYSESNTQVFPSIKYTARQPSDPAGTFGFGEGTIAAGTHVISQANRWGDYASINIDPVDDCTFWATHEYVTNADGFSWSTRVAAFTLPTCSAFSVAKLDDETVAQGGTANYTVTTATTAGAAQQLQLAATGLPAGVTATFNPATIMSGDTAMVTLTADSTAALGMSRYTVTATGTASSQMVDVALTVTQPNTGGDAGNPGGDDDAGGGKGGGCCQSSNDSPIAPALLGLGVIVVIGRRRRR
jgi:MYXO-CTERM domain-containing protein